MKNLVVVGQGYVGLPMAMRAAAVGFTVRGLDLNPAVVDSLNEGRSHIGDVPDTQLAEALRNGYRATTDQADLADADVVLVCVPTPLAEGGGPDLSAVIDAAAAIGENATAGTTVILESTTYPGTTEEVFAPLVLGDRFQEGIDVFVAFSPERINPGDPNFGVQNTPKVVGGMSPASAEKAREFYAQLVDQVVVAAGVREAEMSKLLENTFRHVNIALVNEMVRFSDELDIDLWNAIDCAATKPFGFMPFRPGPGVGGHCIPVDPSYLSHRVKARLGYSFRMVELAEEINEAAPVYVAQRITHLLNDKARSVRGSRILLLGVTYKPNVADLRQTPASHLTERLLDMGAVVEFHDPYIKRWRDSYHEHAWDLNSVEDAYLAASGADLTVLLQAHDDYDLAALADSARLLFDTRGVLDEVGGVHRL